jgi:hypothetical protein
LAQDWSERKLASLYLAPLRCWSSYKLGSGAMVTHGEEQPQVPPGYPEPTEPPAGAGTSDADFPQDLASVVQELRDRIKDLENELKDKESTTEVKVQKEDFETLKPIDIKDIEKPDKYDNDIKKFNMWYDKFQDLLANRRANWHKLLKVVEGNGRNTIKDQDAFFKDLDESKDKSYVYIKAQANIYAQQLKSYMRTYTTGELHARVVQTDVINILELMRETIYKGKNRNPNKLIDLKAKALSPPKANKVNDLEKILTDWKHVRQQIVEEDKDYKMDDETMQTILLKIMPQDFVKDMREQLTQGKHHKDYHGFEQALFDEIATRKMDEESRKSGGNIGAMSGQYGDDDKKHETDHEKYEEIEIWSEEWQCNIMGLAKKRDRSRSRSRGEEERPAKESRGEEGSGGKGGKPKGGKRPQGPCWSCGGAHFQRDCPQSGPGKGYPITTAWSAWRPGSYPGPTASQWNSWLPKFPKGKGKGKGKGKSSGYKGGKGDKGGGKGKGQGQYGNIGELQHQWGPPLGHVQNTYWDTNEFGNLVPICALRNVTEWKVVPTSSRRQKPQAANPKNSVKDTQQNKIHNMFAAFNDSDDDSYDIKLDFPELTDTGAKKENDENKMKKMPKKESQVSRKLSHQCSAHEKATSKSAQSDMSKDCGGPLVKECRHKNGDCEAHTDWKVLTKDAQSKRQSETQRQTRTQARAERGLIGLVGDDANNEEFRTRANNIRKECLYERGCCEEHPRLYNERPLCAVPQQAEEPWKDWMPGWQYLSLTVDSGAAETVIPHMMVQSHPIVETQASRSGLNYASATGDPIPNLGEQKLPLLTQEGSLRAMTFQAAPVDRPLGSVKRMCTSGHTVVFDEEGSYVLNKLTGEVNWMREENGNYIMDLWIMPNKDQSFQRQR